MSGRAPANYSVKLYDRAGPNGSWPAASFAEALAVVARLESEHPGSYIAVYNNDRCDIDTDGLTEEERDELDGVR